MTERDKGLNGRKVRMGRTRRSPNGTDLRKGNHLVCRLSTLIRPPSDASHLSVRFVPKADMCSVLGDVR